MSQWRGWRKALTVLAFIGPTLIGILIFNIYPILFNTYISFTNRNQFHPNPDCSIKLTSIFEPTCWEVFSSHKTSGLGTPFRLQDPLYANYADLMGKLFTPEVLLALLTVVVCFIPLIIIAQVNKYLDKQVTRSVPGWILTLGATLLGIILFMLLKGPDALDKIMNSGDFFVTTFRTIIYVAVCIPLFFIVGLGLALLLNVSDLPGRAFFRVALIVPWAASTVAIMMSLVWKFFFQESGMINQVLTLLNIIPKPIIFLQSQPISFLVIVLVNVWYTYPFFMVTILGALQSIPAELYEAAEVDGASWWQRLMGITLPLLRPAVLPIIVLSSISTFQMFGTVWAITQGGPSRGAGVPGGTELVMIYAYKQVFQTNAYGRMGAFALIMFVFMFGATLYSLRVSRLTKGANQ